MNYTLPQEPHPSLQEELDKPSWSIYGELLSIRECHTRGWIESFKVDQETGLVTSVVFTQSGLDAIMYRPPIRRERDVTEDD